MPVDFGIWHVPPPRAKWCHSISDTVKPASSYRPVTCLEQVQHVHVTDNDYARIGIELRFRMSLTVRACSLTMQLPAIAPAELAQDGQPVKLEAASHVK